MKTLKAGQTVKGGFYYNLNAWAIHLVRKDGERLPGGEKDRFVRMPAVALLAVGPMMGFAFVIFLPLVGFALIFRELGRKIVGLAQARIRLLNRG